MITRLPSGAWSSKSPICSARANVAPLVNSTFVVPQAARSLHLRRFAPFPAFCSSQTCRTIASSSSNSAAAPDDDASSDVADGEDAAAGANSTTSSSSSSHQKPLRVERLLANLGYGGRKECSVMVKRRRLVWAESGQPLQVGEKALAGDLLLDGEPLDPPPPLTLLLHKPTGYVVTSPEDKGVQDPVIYDLLPHRFGHRKPFLSAVGRLDKETSGLLLLTDNGQLLHSIQSPARGIWKRYRAQLAAPLVGNAAAAAARQFASGRMTLHGDRSPLLPALLTMTGDSTAEVAICEGRYHQIRRMFAALGQEVVGLHRHTIGALQLDEAAVPEGCWRLATAADLAAVLAGPPLDLQLQDLAAAGGGDLLLEDDYEQQQQAAGSRIDIVGAAAAEAAGTSLDRRTDAVDDGGGGDEDEADYQEGGELDLEEEQEQLMYRKKYRASSKWAKRRAAIARGVRQAMQQSNR